jgi:PP-loop superfamily ATP-utilizing enzyme
VQVAPDEMHVLAGTRDKLFEVLRKAGFHSVEIDPNGYNPPSA